MAATETVKTWHKLKAGTVYEEVILSHNS